MNTMRTLLFALLLPSMTSLALAEYHQVEKPQAGEGERLVSEPGRAELTRMTVLTARVEGIDAETRTLTLETPDARMVEFVAGDEVRNFDQIEVGDMVEATVFNALRLELVNDEEKSKPEGQEAMARAPEGDKPGAAVGVSVSFMTEVVRVDRDANVISLKGPEGNVVDFDVQNPAQFDVVKVGDAVRATYTEAVAVEVRSAE
jgi:hypothetical protein